MPLCRQLGSLMYIPVNLKALAQYSYLMPGYHPTPLMFLVAARGLKAVRTPPSLVVVSPLPCT